MPISKTPHDHFFKSMMSDPIVARDFFSAHLPEEILKTINLNKLSIEPNSYIDKNLSRFESDILFKTQTKEQKKAYLYLLIEHQSKVDELMPFRILNYIFRILAHDLRQNHHKLPLPFIYPIVFYNGKKPYNGSRDIHTLFEDEHLARKYLFQPFQLIDLTTFNEDVLQQHRFAGLMEWCMLYALNRDILSHVRSFKDFLKLLTQPNHDDMFITVLEYMIQTIDSPDRASQFINLIRQELPKQVEDKMTTLAQKWLQEGKLEGRIEGREEGLEEGKTTGFNQTLSAIELLKQGSPLPEVSNKTGLSLHNLKMLQEKFFH